MLSRIIRIGWILIAACSFITGTVVFLQDGFIAGKAYVWFIICLSAVIILLIKNVIKPRGARKIKKAKR